MSDEPRAGQEAARLLSSVQDWLRTSAPHLAPVDEDGETCSCPICRVVASVREADPDAVGRWVDAAVTAATGALAQATSSSAADGRAGSAESGEGSAEDVHRSRCATTLHAVATPPTDDDPADDAPADHEPADHEPTDDEPADGSPAGSEVVSDVADPAAADASPPEAAPDGPRARRVRPIPVERETGDPTA